MIDAATIGITLALNDGVSEGIARIRRDLASLDAAVSNSALGLARLLAVAADAGPALSARAAPMPPAASAQPTPAPVVGEPGPEARQAAPIAPAPAEAPLARPPEAMAPLDHPSPRAEGPGERRDYASFGRVLAARVEEGDRARPEVPSFSLTSPGATPSVDSGLDHTAPAAPPPTLPQAEVVETRNMLAPLPIQPVSQNASQRQGGNAGMAEPPRAQPGDLPEPTAVEITLDGSVLARWMAGELAQQAGRPPAGAGVFDPRLSPAWLAT